MINLRAATNTISRPAARALVQRLERAANRHDTAALLECYAADAVAISPQFATLTGRTAIARSWDRLFTTLPDCRLEVSDVLVDGDRIAILGGIAATDVCGWFGLPPTGSPIRYRITILCTVRDGAIVHEERIYDSAGVVGRLEKARVDRDLQMAAGVQQALLARTALATSFCDVVTRSVPCRAIGGDFFEIVELPSGSVGLLVGDVAGKGPAAALLAAMLQGVFATEAQAGSAPSHAVSRMNQVLTARHIESRFATIVYAVLSPDGRLVYTSAGHNPPAIVGRDGVRRLSAGGPILGAFADATFDEESIVLNRGDVLLMFSDGVTEARNVSGEEFGDARLMETATSATGDPNALVERIIAAVREFSTGVEQTDDMTVAVARFGK